MPIAFPPTPYSRVPLLSGDAGVAQTIDQMRQLVDQALTDPSIKRLATDIVRGVPAFDDTAEAQALYNWVRSNIRFTKDAVNKEQLYPPSELLQIRAGDCDDISMLLATLLMAVGYPARLMTVAANGDDFSHVYVEALIDGQWIPIDPARSDSQFGVAPPMYTRARWWSLTDSSQGDLPGSLSGHHRRGALLGNYPRFRSHVSGMGSYARLRTMGALGTVPQQATVNELVAANYNPTTINQLISMGATDEQLQALPYPASSTEMQAGVNALVAQLGGGGAAPAATVAAPATASGQTTSSTIATVDQGIADIIRASQGQPASPYSYTSGPYASFQTAYSPGLVTAGYSLPAATTPGVSLTGSSNWLLIAALGIGALLLMRGR
jgi:Transglutaminase-like superfamily